MPHDLFAAAVVVVVGCGDIQCIWNWWFANGIALNYYTLNETAPMCLVLCMWSSYIHLNAVDFDSVGFCLRSLQMDIYKMSIFFLPFPSDTFAAGHAFFPSRFVSSRTQCHCVNSFVFVVPAVMCLPIASACFFMLYLAGVLAID